MGDRRPVVILDTETTSLRPDRRAWDIGMIRIDEAGEREVGAFVFDVDLTHADPMSLDIGRFYVRHPQFRKPGTLRSEIDRDAQVMEEETAARLVEEWTRGATIVGAVPDFDTFVLGDMLRRHRLCPSWHYHLLDVETLVAGYLLNVPRVDWLNNGLPDDLLQLPWKSDELSNAIGVDPLKFDRHTALGDCRWILAQLKAVAPGLISAGST